MYLYYFHVKFKRKYTLEQPSVLIICSAISLHLNTTKTGSGVEDLTTKETKHGSEDKKDKILFPQKAAAIVSINAASGPVAYNREEFTLGRAHLIKEKREDNL